MHWPGTREKTEEAVGFRLASRKIGGPPKTSRSVAAASDANCPLVKGRRKGRPIYEITMESISNQTSVPVAHFSGGQLISHPLLE